ncbi:MAG: glycine cleavage T C-terminal barrel domain-containing protein, partial [Actinomycetota bacterium]
TPIEAGLGFAVAWDKAAAFRGRDALQAQRKRPPSKRLIQFRLEDPSRLAYHDEPILRDGRLVGRTTSGAWSTTEERPLAMGYVVNGDGVTADWLDSGSFEVDIAGHLVPATASIRSFYDPHRHRPRS